MVDRQRLAARLRREARAERPVFSAALHDGVLAAAAAASARRIARPAGRSRAARAAVAIRRVVAAAGCVCAAVAVAAWWCPAPPGGIDAAAVAQAPGIERLPTPAEIGEGVLAEVTTLAADAVGLPAWPDLAALDPAAFAPGDTISAARAAD